MNVAENPPLFVAFEFVALFAWARCDSIAYEMALFVAFEFVALLTLFRLNRSSDWVGFPEIRHGVHSCPENDSSLRISR